MASQNDLHSRQVKAEKGKFLASTLCHKMCPRKQTTEPKFADPGIIIEQLSTSKISSTCPTGVNYISKYAGDLRKKVMKFAREIPIGLDAWRKK